MSAVLTPPVVSPPPAPPSRVLNGKAWTALLAAVITVLVLVPVLNLLVPGRSVS